jgi:hypothetical protein
MTMTLVISQTNGFQAAMLAPRRPTIELMPR